MIVNMFNEDNHQERSMSRNVYSKPAKKYGVFKFIFDCIMTVITGGFWLIWVFVREMRKR